MTFDQNNFEKLFKIYNLNVRNEKEGRAGPCITGRRRPKKFSSQLRPVTQKRKTGRINSSFLEHIPCLELFLSF